MDRQLIAITGIGGDRKNLSTPCVLPKSEGIIARDKAVIDF